MCRSGATSRKRTTSASLSQPAEIGEPVRHVAGELVKRLLGVVVRSKPDHRRAVRIGAGSMIIGYTEDEHGARSGRRMTRVWIRMR